MESHACINTFQLWPIVFGSLTADLNLKGHCRPFTPIKLPERFEPCLSISHEVKEEKGKENTHASTHTSLRTARHRYLDHHRSCGRCPRSGRSCTYWLCMGIPLLLGGIKPNMLTSRRGSRDKPQNVFLDLWGLT
jgi:hypothetical protein